MAETTAISWTTSTYNPWIGCTKVSVSAHDGDTERGGACDNCYAEELDRVRFSKTLGGATKTIPIAHWGPGAPRYRTSQALRWAPHRWNKARERAMSAFARGVGTRPEPHRVFCASLADVFDNEVPQAWRDELWSTINATPYLDWLLLTKRIGLAERMIPPRWFVGFPAHVRLLISISNQFEADRDIPKLLALPCKNGVSYEPALGPVDWRKWITDPCDCKIPEWEGAGMHSPSCSTFTITWGIDWIIVGGESTQGSGKARPFDLAWARSTVAQCKAAGVPAFVKQLGSNIAPVVVEAGSVRDRLFVKHRAGADPAEWPEDLRVQEFAI